jgi:hypothetical protein
MNTIQGPITQDVSAKLQNMTTTILKAFQTYYYRYLLAGKKDHGFWSRQPLKYLKQSKSYIH